MQRRTYRPAAILVLALLITSAVVPPAGAYAEEPILYRDPVTKTITSDPRSEVSTIHFDLTYVMALAAGYSEADARTLMIWDQLVDSNVLVAGNVTYTNCTGVMPPKIQNCPGDNNPVFWPLWSQVPGAGCVTSRYGPFEDFFHFPRRDSKELKALRDWGWGDAQTLPGYQGYVFGPPWNPNDPANPKNMSPYTGFYNYSCMLKQDATIDTGMEPGSLRAFATYLHTLADSFSHQRCQERIDQDVQWPLATHTTPYVPASRQLYECNYLPFDQLKSIADSHHGREFGTMWPDDSGRTKEAVRAVWGELTARGQEKHEALFKPLELNAALAQKGRFHKQTLEEALMYFVEQWNFDEPQARRDYADQLAKLILATRVPIH